MKLRTTLLAAAALLALGAGAQAAPLPSVTGQISLAGYAEAVGATGMGGSTGINFATGASGTFAGNSGGLTSYGAGTGSFSGLTCSNSGGGCGTIMNIASFASEPATTSFLTLTTGGATISFDLTSISSVSHSQDMSGGSVTFTALGEINFSGYAQTAGQFILTAQGNNVVSFSATTLSAGVPEPASIALLGGSLAALGLLRRKKA